MTNHRRLIASMYFTKLADKTAISLSVLCSIHCLLLPLAIVLLPALAGMPFADEHFHMWMVFAVIPTSIFALTLGCRKHQRYHVVAWGGIGVATLVLAVIVGHDLGESWEKGLTLLGSILVATGHILNHRLCKQHECNDECEYA